MLEIITDRSKKCQVISVKGLTSGLHLGIKDLKYDYVSKYRYHSHFEAKEAKKRNFETRQWDKTHNSFQIEFLLFCEKLYQDQVEWRRSAIIEGFLEYVLNASINQENNLVHHKRSKWKKIKTYKQYLNKCNNLIAKFIKKEILAISKHNKDNITYGKNFILYSYQHSSQTNDKFQNEGDNKTQNGELGRKSRPLTHQKIDLFAICRKDFSLYFKLFKLEPPPDRQKNLRKHELIDKIKSIWENTTKNLKQNNLIKWKEKDLCQKTGRKFRYISNNKTLRELYKALCKANKNWDVKNEQELEKTALYMQNLAQEIKIELQNIPPFTIRGDYKIKNRYYKKYLYEFGRDYWDMYACASDDERKVFDLENIRQLFCEEMRLKRN